MVDFRKKNRADKISANEKKLWQRSGTECVDFAGGEFAGGVWAQSRSTPGPCFEETSAIAHRVMFGQAGLGSGPTSACVMTQTLLAELQAVPV